MYLEIIPVAEASVTTLMNSINRVLINPLIFFLFALAMVYFLYGVSKYFLNPDNEEVRKSSKSTMIYGLVGLFVMVAVFGIMRLILNTLGENHIKIQNNGSYQVDQNKTFDTASGLSDPNFTENGTDGKDLTKIGNDLFKSGDTGGTGSTGTGSESGIVTKFINTNLIITNDNVVANVSSTDTGVILSVYDSNNKLVSGPQLTSVTNAVNGVISASVNIKDLLMNTDYTLNLKGQTSTNGGNGGLVFRKIPYLMSPFTESYVSDDQCWRTAQYGKSTLEGESMTLGSKNAKDTLASMSGKNISELEPAILETKTLHDEVNKLYYSWVGIVASRVSGARCISGKATFTGGGSGTGGTGTGSSNGLTISNESNLPIPASILTYKTDSSAYRAYGSGKSQDLNTAKTIAIRNARIRISQEKKVTVLDSISTSYYGDKIFKTSDNYYHYFLVVVDPK